METANGKSEVVFQGRVMTVRRDPVLARSGPGTREVVDRPSAVAVAAETQAGGVVVIRQFRWAVKETLIELPAGLIDPGESPEEAARRELQEETGYRAAYWERAFDCFTSPGFSNERIFVFYARDLTAGDPGGDPDEEISVERWGRDQVREYLAKPSGANGVLVAGLLWWLARSQAF